RRWRLLGRQWTTLRAQRNATGAVVPRRWMRAGAILHGGRPYLWLPEGAYRLLLRGRAAGGADVPVVAAEILARPWSGRIGGRIPARESVLVGVADFTAIELAAGAQVEFVVPRALSLASGDDVPFE